MKFFTIKRPTAYSSEQMNSYTIGTRAYGANVGDAVRCSACRRHLSMLTWLPPYRIEIECMGTAYSDIIEIGREIIVSERVVRVLLDNSITGLSKFEPVVIVKVVHRRGFATEPLPKYFTATVCHSQTAIDQVASRYVWDDHAKVCPECLMDGTLLRHRGLFVMENTWAGEDVFYPRGGNGPLVTERFKSVVEGNRLTGLVFTPSGEEINDFFPWITGERTGTGGPA